MRIKKIKLFLFADELTIYIESTKEQHYKLLELLSDYSKVAGYRFIYVHFYSYMLLSCFGKLSFKMLFSSAAAAKSLQLCLTPCDPIDGSPPGSPIPGILQASTGVGCHFLLQCMKVKSESEVIHLCPTLCDPMDCSLPGSSSHGIFQARVGCHRLLRQAG